MVKILCCIIFFSAFSACSETGGESPSSDRTALDQWITLDIKSAALKWEIVRSPGDDGFLPAPIDYTTLIVEAEDASGEWLSKARAPTGEVWLVAEAARPWLKPAFQKIVKGHGVRRIDLTNRFRCKAYSGVLKKSRKLVHGYLCPHGSNALIYLTVADYTKGNH